MSRLLLLAAFVLPSTVWQKRWRFPKPDPATSSLSSLLALTVQAPVPRLSSAMHRRWRCWWSRLLESDLCENVVFPLITTDRRQSISRKIGRASGRERVGQYV